MLMGKCFLQLVRKSTSSGYLGAGYCLLYLEYFIFFEYNIVYMLTNLCIYTRVKEKVRYDLIIWTIHCT